MRLLSPFRVNGVYVIEPIRNINRLLFNYSTIFFTGQSVCVSLVQTLQLVINNNVSRVPIQTLGPLHKYTASTYKSAPAINLTVNRQ